MRYAIGIDLGGTNLKGGVVGEDGHLLLQESRPTPPGGGPAEAILQALIDLAHYLRAQSRALGHEPAGIGFGMPNILEGPDWIQRQVNNLPAMEGLALRPPLVEALGEPLAMDNDVMNASLAEYHFGDAHQYPRVFMFFIGTGIASGIFTEGGHQLRYTSGWTGDTGHIIVDPQGLPCTCGGRGCLETVATGPAIRRKALAHATSGQSPLLAACLAAQGDLTARDAAEAAAAGDEGARQIWEQTGMYVGMALTSYIHIFDPSVILIGGGLAQAGDLLLNPIRRTIDRLASPYYRSHLQSIRPAKLGVEAGIVGAAALILRPNSVR